MIPMKKSLLDTFRLTVQERQLGVYGIHISQKGKGDLSHFWRSDDKVCLHSGSKTFTSLAVGICNDRGLFGLDDKVLDFFPEYRAEASEGSQNITLRHLLHMASGKKEFLFAGAPERMWSHDWAWLFFTDLMKDEAGAEFYYSNACTYMLSRVVEKVTGKTLRDFLLPLVFEPLGIPNPQWHTCPGGHTLGATELYLTNGEFARLGQVLLNRGVYQDKILVSEAYLKDAVADTIPSPGMLDPESNKGYGYQLWLCSYPGAYRADGLYGQFCIVFPQEQAVVTLTSHEEKRPNDLLRVVYEDIVPRLE